jgi:hypothetical protein
VKLGALMLLTGKSEIMLASDFAIASNNFMTLSIMMPKKTALTLKYPPTNQRWPEMKPNSGNVGTIEARRRSCWI